MTRNGQLMENTASDRGVPIRVDRIRVFEGQPRHYFNEARLRALGRSLRRKQRKPIEVKRITGDPDHDFELIDGERRWRASKLEGLDVIRALIVKVESRDEQYVDSFVSNLQREDLTHLEKAEALGRLQKMGMSRDDIADECGAEDPSWIDDHLALLDLVPEVQALMDPERPKEKQLPFAIAVQISKLSPALQQDVAEEIVDKKMRDNHARLLITTRAHEAGEKIRTRRNPNKEFQIVSGFVKRINDESKLILGMPNTVFVKMFSQKSKGDMQVLVGQFEASIATLEKIVAKIRTSKKVSRDLKSRV